MDTTSIKDFLPLIQVLIGGLLTVVGGFTASYFLQSVARKVDKKKLIREKLEQVYILTIQTSEWIKSEMRQTVAPIEKEKTAEKNPVDQIEMLIILYEPSLKNPMQDLKEKVDYYRRSLFSYWSKLLKNGNHLSTKKYEELFKKPVEEADESVNRFRVALENEFKKYL